MKVSVWPIVLIAVTACDVGSFDPGDPPEIDLTGDWSYTAELIGDLVTCEITGLVIHIEHTGERLTGSTEGGIAECIFPDEFVRVSLEPLPLRDGRLVGPAQFIMSFGEGEMWRHGGDVVLPTFLRGTTDMTRDFGGELGVVEFPTGTWSANKL